MVVQEHFNDLVVATYGRGFWILDDITPLQQLTADVANSDAHLFAPRQAYRFRPTLARWASYQDPTEGQNPPYGASIDYYLGSEPTDSVKLEIQNQAGETVRTLDATKNVGVNRVWWDLQFERTKQAKLRTSPLYAPWVKLGDEGWREAPGLGRFSILAPPGTYQVKLTVGERELVRPLTVLKDPNSPGTAADISRQTELLNEMRDNLNAVVDMVNSLELIRGQLYALKAVLEGHDGADTVQAAAKALDDKLIAVEAELHQMKLTGRGQDAIRWPAMLGEQIAYLADNVSSSDMAPTTQAVAVHQELTERLHALQRQYDELMRVDVAAFNALLVERAVQGVVVPQQ
jgi:hypothetical protein